MGMQNYIGTDLRIANTVTFIPGAEAKNNRALVTAMSNTKARDGKTYSDEVSLIFWGKRASVAAMYLYPGKQINVYGRYQSHAVDNGQVRADGRKALERRVQVVVSHMELLGDSMKFIEGIVSSNIGKLKAAGRLPAELTISAKELLDNPKSGVIEFSLVNCANGKYGLARVWTKEQGFLDKGQVAPSSPANAEIDEIARLKAEIAGLKATSAAEGAVDPFAK